MADAPARLRVQADLDGFRCELPGEAFGPNSAWALVFVASWWGMALAVAAGLSPLFPDLFDGDLDLLRGALGLVATMGWVPAWYAFDAWWVHARTRPLEADAVGVRFDGESWLYSDLERLEVSFGKLRLRIEGADRWIPLGVTPAEEAWLKQRLEGLYEAARQRQGEAPAAIQALRSER